MELPPSLRQWLAPYGSVPLRPRTLREVPARLEALRPRDGGSLGAAGLVWNDHGEVLLLQEDIAGVRAGRWAPPGGMAEGEETPDETFRREVREETGLEITLLALTCVHDLTVTDGDRTVRGYLFQFEGRALDAAVRPGSSVREWRWFDHLPEDMAFREDYLAPFTRRRRSRGGSGGQSRA